MLLEMASILRSRQAPSEESDGLHAHPGMKATIKGATLAGGVGGWVEKKDFTNRLMSPLSSKTSSPLKTGTMDD